MQRIFLQIITILFMCQFAGCTMIYHSVKEKRDRSYREGVDLYNQNKYEEAHDRFKTVVDIEPDYKEARSYLTKTEKLIKLKEKQIKQKANQNYNQGVALLKRQKYEEALTYLLQAKNEDPDLVDVDEKIDECRTKLAPKLKQLLQQTKRLYNAKQYIQAYQAYLKTKFYSPSNAEAEELKGKIEEKLNEKAKKYKTNGWEYYKKKQYAASQQQLQLALKNNPWDNESKDMLNKVNGRLNLDKNYNNAITLYNNADYFAAKSAFTSVNNVEQGYKATDHYLNKINSILSARVPEIYNNGLALYEKGDYQSAVTEFNRVLSINPGHTMAQEYLQRAKSKLEIQKSLQGGK